MLLGGFQKTMCYWVFVFFASLSSLHPHHHSDTTPSPHISQHTHIPSLRFPFSSMISCMRYKTPAEEREPCLKRSSAARVGIERGSQRSTIKKVTVGVLCSCGGGDFKKRRPNSVQTKTRFGFLIVKYGNSFYRCGLTTTAFNMLPVGCLDGGRVVQGAFGKDALVGFSLTTYSLLGFGVLLSLPWGLYVLICQVEGHSS